MARTCRNEMLHINTHLTKSNPIFVPDFGFRVTRSQEEKNSRFLKELLSHHSIAGSICCFRPFYLRHPDKILL